MEPGGPGRLLEAPHPGRRRALPRRAGPRAQRRPADGPLPRARRRRGRSTAFVNIGGSTANIGTNAEVLEAPAGPRRRRLRAAPAERGVLQAMAAEGVPVIHLLNVKGPLRALRPALGPAAPARRREEAALPPGRVRPAARRRP
ncbi:MAG: hypothetical protein MZV63_58600 [Marinilabiliales bacterium]|nr:hypothetical protein [Marinilabiliales bacterium]